MHETSSRAFCEKRRARRYPIKTRLTPQSPTIAWALASAVIFLSLSLAFGQKLPQILAPYPYFSFLPSEAPTAVPGFLADGKWDTPERYDRFVGINFDNDTHLGPKDVIASIDRFYKQRQWILDHRDLSDGIPGPVHCKIGYWMISWNASGPVRPQFRPVAEGSAWPR